MALRVGFQTLNTSIQVEDHLYFVPPGNIELLDDFNFTNTTPGYIGRITNIGPVPNSDLIWVLAIEEDGAGNDITIGPGQVPDGSMFMFRKDNRANIADLTGYYAQIKLVNNSSYKAELFSIGSNATINSK